VVTWEEVRHQVAIAGRVTDARMGRAIGGALVMITTAPPAFSGRDDRTRTAADGHFHFLDLPDGQYALTASLPGSGRRYGTASAQATVSRDSQGKITMATATIGLPSTTLTGRVTGQNAAPVAMAEVRVQGSGERAFSDGQGDYRLAGLETGNRTVQVSAQGYQVLSRTVLLSQAGTVQTLNLSLVPATP
jgi:Carboxypeptidase regulatory-like domain